MAEIAPLRGELYQVGTKDPARLLAPPYDVIDEAGRNELEALDSHNVVRLILPRGEGDARYAEAARLLSSWRQEGILARDAMPALYRYHQTFHAVGREYTRRGFIGLCRLRRFDEGVVLPHERTLSAPKADRLKLTRATSAYFSQVFGLYRDATGDIDAAFSGLEATAPSVDAVTHDGLRQQLWKLTNPEAISRVAAALRDRTVVIADGHHRYETAIAYRDEMRVKHPDAGPNAAFEFGVMFFCNAEEPGLVVLPTHRLVHSLQSFNLSAFLQAASAFFVVEVVDGERTAQEVTAGLESRGAGGRSAFAVAMPDKPGVTYLTLKPDLDLAALVPGAPVLRRLDVAVLHALVVGKLLGITPDEQEKQTHIAYVKDTGKALDRVHNGEGQLLLLMRATPVAQVQECAEAGVRMPQKSTFFYPKLASGLVIFPVDVDTPIAVPAA